MFEAPRAKRKESDLKRRKDEQVLYLCKKNSLGRPVIKLDDDIHLRYPCHRQLRKCYRQLCSSMAITSLKM